MRVIPVLLLDGEKLVKTKKFKNGRYVGDPINAVRIFNEKEVDELVLFDINTDKYGRKPNFQLLERIVSEAFMPIGYGGAIRNLETAKELFRLGIEKLIFNSALIEDPLEIRKIVDHFGSQSVVACLNFKKSLFGSQKLYLSNKGISANLDLNQCVNLVRTLGFGEVLIQSVDRDGMRTGLDLSLAGPFVKDLDIPIVLAGGADSVEDCFRAKLAGVSGIAAGSMFVFQGKHQAVLITYTNPFTDL